MTADDLNFVLAFGKIHGQFEQEPVQLGLGKRVGALVFDGVLRRRHDKRLGQQAADPVHADLTLFHGLQQRGLRLGRGPVDLVREHDVGEHRAFAEAEIGGVRVVDQRTGDIARHQIGCELHPFGIQVKCCREGAHHQGLRDAGNPLQEHMALGQQGDEEPGDRGILSHDGLGHLVTYVQ